MKPGRKPIPRAERLSRGLPVCRIDGCDYAPGVSGRCDRHRRDGSRPHRRATGVVTATLYAKVRPDLVLAVKLEAVRRNVYPAVVVEEALAVAAKGWGAPT